MNSNSDYTPAFSEARDALNGFHPGPKNLEIKGLLANLGSSWQRQKQEWRESVESTWAGSAHHDR